MTEITNEFVQKLVDCEDDWEQFSLIKDLTRDELESVVSMLLGMMKCKQEIIKIVKDDGTRVGYDTVIGRWFISLISSVLFDAKAA